MALKGQSIRKGVIIYLNGEIVVKQIILDLSESWSEFQENFFKHMVKQGGEFKIKENKFNIILQDQVLTSRGEKDVGIIIYPESF